MAKKLLALLLLTTTLSACFHKQVIKKTHKISVTTDPPKAHVWREDEAGRQAVGRAPLELSEEYEETTTKVRPMAWVTWALLAAGTTALIVWAATSDSDSAQVYGSVGGGLLGVYAVTGPFYLGWLHNRVTTKSHTLKLGASSPGYSDAWLKLQVPAALKKGETQKFPNLPSEEKAHIVLSPAGGKVTSAPTSTPAADEPKRPIVAVFDLEDNKRKLDAQTAGELAEYLATQLTATGKYRTVPRSQLRKRLSGEKKKGYKACFDEACQIELGRALAAQKSLATKIIRVGNLCTLNSVLYDLKTETSERAASTEGPCTTEALLASLRAQAKKLAGK